MSKYKVVLFLIFSLCLITKAAHANVGVPMIFITMPMMVAGLIPITLIEGFILKKYLEISKKKAFISSAIANTFSTFVGIPVTWGILLLLQMITGGASSHGITTPLQKFLAVTWQAPWLVPYEKELFWMVPIAMLVLLVPFFFSSWKIEAFVIKKLNKNLDYKKISHVCLKGNTITYALLTPVIALYFFG